MKTSFHHIPVDHEAMKPVLSVDPSLRNLTVRMLFLEDTWAGGDEPVYDPRDGVWSSAPSKTCSRKR